MRCVEERISVRITAEIDVAHARQEARRLAGRHGFGTVRAHGLATAVSELGTNLVFHARHGGIISLTAWMEQGASVIEVTAMDDGPGIADIDLAMEDGYSTRGSLGCGLPGTRRLVDEFAITSAPGAGTCVTCMIRRA